MLRCPDDGSFLAPGTPCPDCGGRAVTGAVFAERWPGASLVPEAEADAEIPRPPPRSCPLCGTAMPTLWLGAEEAWLERCASCDVLWVERDDLATLARLETQETPPGPTGFFGAIVPLVEGRGEAPMPHATAALAFGLLAVTVVVLLTHAHLDFVVGRSGPAQSLLAALAPMAAFPPIFSILFVLACGDVVEQRLGAWALLALFLAGGVASILVDAALLPKGTSITGPIGGALALMAAAVAAAPRARVRLHYHALWKRLTARVPVWAVALLPALGLAGLAAGAPYSGGIVDWRGQLAACALGVVVGLGWRWRQPAAGGTSAEPPGLSSP